FDDSQSCLKCKATEMWVLGHGYGFASPGSSPTPILIDTQAAVPADPPIREIVHIVSADEETDPILLDAASNPTKVTHIVWDAKDALQFDHDLDRTQVAGNLVPATQGHRLQESFAIDTPPASNIHMPLAVVRTGPNSTPGSFSPMYLYSLGKSPLAWLAPDLGTEPTP